MLRWGEVNPVWSHTLRMFLVFLLFSLVFIRLLLGIAGTTILQPSPCHCFPPNPNFPALSVSQLQDPKWCFVPLISGLLNTTRAEHTRSCCGLGFPCTAAVVGWEKLKFLHPGCAERSILSPSVSQPLEQPRASAWHHCWGNAGKHWVKKNQCNWKN